MGLQQRKHRKTLLWNRTSRVRRVPAAGEVREHRISTPGAIFFPLWMTLSPALLSAPTSPSPCHRSALGACQTQFQANSHKVLPAPMLRVPGLFCFGEVQTCSLSLARNCALLQGQGLPLLALVSPWNLPWWTWDPEVYCFLFEATLPATTHSKEMQEHFRKLEQWQVTLIPTFKQRRECCICFSQPLFLPIFSRIQTNP